MAAGGGDIEACRKDMQNQGFDGSLPSDHGVPRRARSKEAALSAPPWDPSVTKPVRTRWHLTRRVGEAQFPGPKTLEVRLTEPAKRASSPAMQQRLHSMSVPHLPTATASPVLPQGIFTHTLEPGVILIDTVARGRGEVRRTWGITAT